MKKVNRKSKRRIKIKSTLKGFAYVSLKTYGQVNHNYITVKFMIHFLLLRKNFIIFKCKSYQFFVLKILKNMYSCIVISEIILNFVCVSLTFTRAINTKVVLNR